MAGKAVLFLVISTFIIFSRFGLQSASVVNRSFDKMADYQAQSSAYNVAVAGANVAFSRLNTLLPSPPIISDMSNVAFNGGEFTISCSPVAGTGNYTLTSTGRYTSNNKTYQSKVTITYQPGGWGRYAYYSENEGAGIYWMAQDAIYGPFHTQSDILNVSRRPYFGGEASMKGTNVHYETNYDTDNPNFVKGLFTGVDRPMTDNSLDSVNAAAVNGNSWWITGHSTVYLTFANNQVKYKWSRTGTETTKNISDVTRNGVIYVESGDVHIKGVVSGQVTVYAKGPAGSTNQGNIWLDDDITLTNSSRTNPNSTDFLGLVAINNVWITDKDDANNTYNNNSINIEAAIYCHEGGFGAQNYNNRGVDGAINLYGGIVQNTRKAVSTFSGKSISSGFSKNYRYDERFENKWPPFYPCGRAYRILSWFDGVGNCDNTY